MAASTAESPLFERTRATLVALAKKGLIELESTPPDDLLVEALMRFLVARQGGSLETFGEWLLDQDGVSEVYGSDADLEKALAGQLAG